ncbi:transcriptional regulator [Maribacter algicola]|uniref:Transcriptional regulator n=1 Tax=Meishania litoralis TaxID=3434685 RepID=A0ACC7LML4_9FLAO
MIAYAEKYKGIHPGRVLKRELKKRSLKQRPFALSIGEHPQTLNAITNERRDLNTALALKIESKLGLKEGSLVLLQAFYDIKKEKEGRNTRTPDFSILRKSLFWDTDIEKIDWKGKYKAVIRRVLERGNALEKNEISRFYGAKKVAAVTNSMNDMTTSP